MISVGIQKGVFLYLCCKYIYLPIDIQKYTNYFLRIFYLNVEMARKRATKKYGRSIYSPKRGRKYSQKQVYKYYYGGIDSPEKDEDEVVKDVNNLEELGKPTEDPVSDEPATMENTPENPVSNEPATMENTQTEDVEPEENAPNVDGEGNVASNNSFVDTLQGTLKVASDSLKNEYNELLGTSAEENESEEEPILETTTVSGDIENKVKALEETVNKLKDTVENTINVECAELKEKVKQLESEKSELQKDLLDAYKKTSSNSSQGLNEDMDSKDLLLDNSEVITEPESDILEKGSADNVYDDDLNTLDNKPTEINESSMGESEEKPTEINESSMGESEEKPTEINESSLVEQEAKPTEMPSSLTEEESDVVEEFPGEITEKPLETPLESTNKPSLQQGGKSKRRRRTIRKSKKQPKYRYVY